MNRLTLTAALLLTTGVLSLGGCPNTDNPNSGTIIIRVINDTDFVIEPRIDTAAATGSFFSIGDGAISPRQTVDFEIDCASAARIRAVQPFQVGSEAEFQLDSTPTFVIDQAYFCGEIVEFEFTGNEENFDLAVLAGNGTNAEQIFP